MSEPIDYKTVKTVKFNGSDIKKIMFNGVRVWERIETPVYTQEYQTSGYWQEYKTYVSDGYWANSTSYVSSGYWATGTRQVTVSSTCTRTVNKCRQWWGLNSGGAFFGTGAGMKLNLINVIPLRMFLIPIG